MLFTHLLLSQAHLLISPSQSPYATCGSPSATSTTFPFTLLALLHTWPLGPLTPTLPSPLNHCESCSDTELSEASTEFHLSEPFSHFNSTAVSPPSTPTSSSSHHKYSSFSTTSASASSPASSTSGPSSPLSAQSGSSLSCSHLCSSRTRRVIGRSMRSLHSSWDSESSLPIAAFPTCSSRLHRRTNLMLPVSPYAHPILVSWNSRNSGSVRTRSVSASLCKLPLLRPLLRLLLGCKAGNLLGDGSVEVRRELWISPFIGALTSRSEQTTSWCSFRRSSVLISTAPTTR